PDAERASEQPGLEHHVVTRRRLAGLGRIRRRPVVLGEDERGEIDLLGELDEPIEGGPPRVERGRPGLELGDVLEPARDRLGQFRLLARRPEENPRLVQARSMMTDARRTRKAQGAVSGALCSSGGRIWFRLNAGSEPVFGWGRALRRNIVALPRASGACR